MKYEQVRNSRSWRSCVSSPWDGTKSRAGLPEWQPRERRCVMSFPTSSWRPWPRPIGCTACLPQRRLPRLPAFLPRHLFRQPPRYGFCFRYLFPFYSSFAYLNTWHCVFCLCSATWSTVCILNLKIVYDLVYVRITIRSFFRDGEGEGFQKNVISKLLMHYPGRLHMIAVLVLFMSVHT